MSDDLLDVRSHICFQWFSNWFAIFASRKTYSICAGFQNMFHFTKIIAEDETGLSQHCEMGGSTTTYGHSLVFPLNASTAADFPDPFSRSPVGHCRQGMLSQNPNHKTWDDVLVDAHVRGQYFDIRSGSLWNGHSAVHRHPYNGNLLTWFTVYNHFLIPFELECLETMMNWPKLHDPIISSFLCLKLGLCLFWGISWQSNICLETSQQDFDDESWQS